MQVPLAGLESRLRVARELASGAGVVLMRHFGRLEHVDRKGSNDLVSAADRDAEALLVQGLRDAFPGDAILAEEGGGAIAGADGWCWLVDPLDGTTNFVHGLEHFCVSVGLAFDRQPVLGVIHAPFRGVTYRATLGGGAWADDRPIRVSDREPLGDALLATGFPYDRAATSEELIGPLRRALEQARGLRRLGSAALDLVDVARGVFDGYWEARLQPWDVAAGVVLVREAGGRVSDLAGGEHDVFRASVLASNGRLHEALVRMVAGGPG